MQKVCSQNPNKLQYGRIRLPGSLPAWRCSHLLIRPACAFRASLGVRSRVAGGGCGRSL